MLVSRRRAWQAARLHHQPGPGALCHPGAPLAGRLVMSRPYLIAAVLSSLACANRAGAANMQAALAALLLAVCCVREASAGYSWNSVLNNKDLQHGDVRTPCPASCRRPHAPHRMFLTRFSLPCCSEFATAGCYQCQLTSIPAARCVVGFRQGAVSASARQPSGAVLCGWQ